MQKLFGYRCQECGKGTVVEKVFAAYQTKVKGRPLTLANARIGVCDRCGAEHFDPTETRRWRQLLGEHFGPFGNAQEHTSGSDDQGLAAWENEGGQ